MSKRTIPAQVTEQALPVPVPANELPEGVTVGYDLCGWRVMVDADGSICTMPAPGTERFRRLSLGCVDTLHRFEREVAEKAA